MRRIAFLALVLIVVISVCWAASMKLMIQGKLASTDVRVINGKAYAPIADVAKAMNMVVNKSGSTYSMVVPGGAYQVQGSKQGKIGSQLFTGKWKFQVVSVETDLKEYQEMYYQPLRTIKPQGSGDRLIVVKCKLWNGLPKTTQSPLLTERIPHNTALTDSEGTSYQPIDYDARQKEDKIQSYEGAPMLPGSVVSFALVFSAPKGTEPKSLVFNIGNYSDNVVKPGTDLRVELQK